MLSRSVVLTRINSINLPTKKWSEKIYSSFSFADIPCTLQIKAIKARSLKNAFDSPNLA